MASKSLDDSLYLAKRSIIDFFKDLLEERRRFKYILSVRVTFKKWDNVTYSDPIIVINKRLKKRIKYRYSI